ncbi:EamA family transporter [Xylanimonas oleitrophica]|uniref:EamA family transporter n=1 Tax=Xylanimonas oleitrophica TaxID=2607479 RepID=A0A2W5X110_9MICO|nr:EamA family transporter [Xylanimonas oleitrophica]
MTAPATGPAAGTAAGTAVAPGPRWAAPAAVAVTLVLWASAFVGVRAAGHDYSPLALTLGRHLVGSVALTAVVAVAAARRGAWPRLPRGRALAAVAAWGTGWFGLYNLALNAAERHLDAGTTALLVNVAPVLVAVLAGLLLGEGFPRRLLAGVAVAFAGVALIAVTTSTGAHDAVGVALGLTAAVVYALGATAQKRILAHVDALTMTWLGCVAATVACLPFTGALVRDVAAAPTSSTLAVVYLGALPTAVAFTTWGYALARSSAGRLAASTFLVPPIVVGLSWLLLAEAPAPLAFVGGAVSLAGVALATSRRRRR